MRLKAPPPRELLEAVERLKKNDQTVCILLVCLLPQLGCSPWRLALGMNRRVYKHSHKCVCVCNCVCVWICAHMMCM